MDEGKIYITITDQRIGGETTGKPPQQPTDNGGQEKEDKNLLGDYIKHRFFSLVQEQAKQMVNYAISNIGNFTGDYQTQREIEVGLKATNLGVNLVTSFVAGFTATGGNVIGGAVAVGIVVATSAISYGLQETVNKVNNRNQNYNIAQLREISGLDALTNGGR